MQYLSGYVLQEIGVQGRIEKHHDGHIPSPWSYSLSDKALFFLKSWFLGTWIQRVKIIYCLKIELRNSFERCCSDLGKSWWSLSYYDFHVLYWRVYTVLSQFLYLETVLDKNCWLLHCLQRALLLLLAHLSLGIVVSRTVLSLECENMHITSHNRCYW